MSFPAFLCLFFVCLLIFRLRGDLRRRRARAELAADLERLLGKEGRELLMPGTTPRAKKLSWWARRAAKRRQRTRNQQRTKSAVTKKSPRSAEDWSDRVDKRLVDFGRRKGLTTEALLQCGLPPEVVHLNESTMEAVFSDGQRIPLDRFYRGEMVLSVSPKLSEEALTRSGLPRPAVIPESPPVQRDTRPNPTLIPSGGSRIRM